MQWIIIASYILVSHQCAGNSTTTEGTIPPIVELLSDQNQMKLNQYNEFEGVTLKGYEHFNPSMLGNVSESGRRKADYYLRGFNPGAYAAVRMCYIIQTSWRRGIRDLLNYYKLRDLYIGTMDYEIGYVTHVVIAKYMDTLELFDIVRHRFLGGGTDKPYAPTHVMFFLYINILENSRSIIHFCNMLHEIKRKYKYAIRDTPWDQQDRRKRKKKKRKPRRPGQQQLPGRLPEPEPPEEIEHPEPPTISHQEYLQKQEDELRKKQRDAIKKQKLMIKYGHLTVTTTVSTRPHRYWKNNHGDYDYGWSIEEDAW